MAFPWLPLAMFASTMVDAMLSNKSYPPELEAFLKDISIQGRQLLSSPGLSETEVSALFGKEFENIKGMKGAQDIQRSETLGRMGMSKTGTAVKASQQDAWLNQNLVTNALRDVMIARKTAKQQDQMLATQMAQMAIGGEANRQEKGPDFSSMVAMLAMMEPEGGYLAKKPGAGLVPSMEGVGGIGAGLQSAPSPYSLGANSIFGSGSSMFQQGGSLFSDNDPLSVIRKFGW